MKKSVQTLHCALGALLSATLLLTACADDAAPGRIGSTCGGNGQCESGLCDQTVCLDPNADNDIDGLINSLEVALGTNPLQADTDGDGIDDGDELTGTVENVDTDDDGIPDALESAVHDADNDCITDQYDAENTVANGDLSPMIKVLCRRQGVCGAPEATLAVSCPGDASTAICDYAGVADHVDDEATTSVCDELDNDCDGQTDEDQSCDSLTDGLIAHYPLDGDGTDISGNDFTATVHGSGHSTYDRFGNADQAWMFNADGDHLSADISAHPTGEVTVTYAAWVKPATAGFGSVRGLLNVGDVLAANARSGLVLLDQGNCAQYVGEGNDVSGEDACPVDGHWSHVAVTKAGTNVQFYVNGRLIHSGQTASGQSLTTTDLVIGLSKASSGDSGVYEQFIGAMDDVRIYDRVLGISELSRLYYEGSWSDVGTPGNPGRECEHILDNGHGDEDGHYWLDPDGDDDGAPFQAYCMMSEYGGGWTLVWLYGFTNFDNFVADDNAVTPIPSWPAPLANVAVSTTAPSVNPNVPGAIDFAQWRHLGAELLVVSSLNDAIQCAPSQGNLGRGNSGSMSCQNVGDVASACSDVAPTRLDWGDNGPMLSASDLYYYFDGNTLADWPTHDPCGVNQDNQRSTPSGDEGAWGAVLLRWSDAEAAAPLLPRDCDEAANDFGITWDGAVEIDPDGAGGPQPALEVHCLNSAERGGWTQMKDVLLDTIEEEGSTLQYLLYERETGSWYRSPVTSLVWDWETYQALSGQWTFQSSDNVGSFDCGDLQASDHGIGCSNGPGSEAKVWPQAAASFDAAQGTTTICQDQPGIFNGDSPCASGIAVYVRLVDCVPDDQSALGDGKMTTPTHETNHCWWTGHHADYATEDIYAESEDAPPGGSPPSLRVSNPTVDNTLWDVQLTQSHLGLIDGHAYQISFWAKAASDRTIRVLMQDEDGLFGYSDLVVGTQWQWMSIDFVAERTSWDAYFEIQFGQLSTADVWVDDVRLLERGAYTCTPSGDNLLSNASFEDGELCWDSWVDDALSGQWALSQQTAPESIGQFSLRAEYGPGAGDDKSAVTLRQDGLSLELDRHYYASFIGKADAEAQGHFRVGDESGQHFAETDFTMRPYWGGYTFDVLTRSSQHVETSSAYVEFQMAMDNPVAFNMDDIALVDGGPNPCIPTENTLVQAGGFDGGTTLCWQTNAGDGGFSIDWNDYPSDEFGPSLRATNGDPSSSVYDVQLVQRGFTVRDGIYYQLRFWIKADSPRTVPVLVHNWEDFNQHLYQEVSVSEIWEEKVLNFSGPLGGDDVNALLEFQFGGEMTGDVWVDGIELRPMLAL